jgi:phosphatidylglycerol:prolipoprotein diacylglycerol transferase
MIEIGIDPILLRWGPLALSWHGLLLAAGVLAMYLMVVREGTRKGFSRQSLSELALWSVVPGILGARLLFVLGDWRSVVNDPLSIFALHEGGITVNGAILGVFLGTIVYARRKQIPLWKLADTLAIAAPLAFVLGRVGCTIIGDVWGVPTNGSWGLVYTHANAFLPLELLGVATWPAPIALQIWNLGLYLLLRAVQNRMPGDGYLFGIYVTVYALGRFLVNTWQAGEAVLFGLKYLQIVALVLITLGIMVLIFRRYRMSLVSRDRRLAERI